MSLSHEGAHALLLLLGSPVASLVLVTLPLELLLLLASLLLASVLLASLLAATAAPACC
jgi:hypothetical protein